MVNDPINTWLHRTIDSSIKVNLFGSIALLILGVILLFVTYAILFALTGFFFAFADAPRVHSLLALACLAAVFAANFFLTPVIGGAGEKQGASIESKAAQPKPDSLKYALSMALYVVCCGPKAITQAVKMLQKALRLRKMDFDGCAAVLFLLVTRDSRVAYTEIKSRLPRVNSLTVFGQLEDVDGVLFLESEPRGISLTEDLRRELSMFIPATK